MRKFLFAMTCAASLLAVGAAPAVAHDTCHPAVKAKGGKDDSMRSAMGKAIGAWEKAVEKKYDDDYDSWRYSADRAIDCKWKLQKGSTDHYDYTCTATARPCARDH